MVPSNIDGIGNTACQGMAEKEEKEKTSQMTYL